MAKMTCFLTAVLQLPADRRFSGALPRDLAGFFIVYPCIYHSQLEIEFGIKPVRRFHAFSIGHEYLVTSVVVMATDRCDVVKILRSFLFMTHALPHVMFQARWFQVKAWFDVKIKVFKDFYIRAAAIGRPSYFFLQRVFRHKIFF